MSEKRVASMHFGGPLGLAGLVLLAGAAGIVILDSTTGEDGQVTSTPGIDEPETPVDQTDPQTPNVPIIDEPIDPPVTDPGVVDPPITEPDVPNVMEPTKPPVVSSKPDTDSQPATQSRAEATFIVRIKGEPEVDEAAKLFRKDRATAEKAFADYQASTPEFQDFRLVGASYSGELKLAYEFEPGVEPTRAEVKKVQEKIMAVKGVAYADPDYIAHPGKKD